MREQLYCKAIVCQDNCIARQLYGKTIVLQAKALYCNFGEAG